MNIKEIYDISNDSLSDDTLSEILDMNSDFEHSLYDKLIGNNGIKSIYPLYQDDLFEKVKFTSWVNLIIENSKDKKVLKELSDTHKFQRKEDIERFVWDFKERNPMFSNYPMSSRSWNRMNSNASLMGTKYSQSEMKHALYLSLDNNKVYNFINMLTISCMQAKVPFEYSFRLDYEADDKVVVYATDESLESMIKIIDSIIESNPKLINKERQLPILTTKIRPWLGYGSGFDKTGSFHRLRSEILEEAIFETNQKWFNESDYANNDVKLKNDIVDSIVKFLNKLSNGSSEKTSITVPTLEARNVEEIDYNTLMLWKNDGISIKSLDMLLDKLKNKEDISNFKILCTSKNKRKAMHFYEGFINHLSKYTAASKESIDYLRTCIKDKCPKYGIDSNNFAFANSVSSNIKENTYVEEDCYKKVV